MKHIYNHDEYTHIYNYNEYTHIYNYDEYTFSVSFMVFESIRQKKSKAPDSLLYV
jgi:hypothetical protein